MQVYRKCGDKYLKSPKREGVLVCFVFERITDEMHQDGTWGGVMLWGSVCEIGQTMEQKGDVVYESEVSNGVLMIIEFGCECFERARAFLLYFCYYKLTRLQTIKAVAELIYIFFI